MAKWKEPSQTEQHAVSLRVDPRVRMKEIRAEVKAYLKGENPNGLLHMGELPDNLEDARRVIVAVQDLMEIEREKHRKATNHICELVHILEGMSETQQELMDMIYQRDRHIRDLNNQVEVTEKHGYHMRDEMRQSQQERDAVLLTMKLLSGQQPQPTNQETSMSMVMGHSNRNRG